MSDLVDPLGGWMRSCVLIAPSPLNEHWLTNLEEALQAQNRVLEVVESEITPVPEVEQPVYVAFSPDKLQPAVGGESGLVLATAGTVVLAVGADGIEAIRRASVVYAEYSMWPADVTVTEALIASSADDLVEVLPGLGVAIPDYSSFLSNPLVAAAKPGLSPFTNGQPVVGGESDWTTGVLTDVSRSKAEPQLLSGDIDLTGRPRQLITGPYFRLTPGCWRLKLQFSLWTAGAVNLRIEWGEPGRCVQLLTGGKGCGRYRAILEQEWLATGTAEIVVELLDAKIDGTLKFDRILIEKVAA